MVLKRTELTENPKAYLLSLGLRMETVTDCLLSLLLNPTHNEIHLGVVFKEFLFTR